MKSIGVIVLGIILIISLSVQFYSFYRFKSVGARFTSQDGQELCLRIQILEHYSIGFKQSGLLGTECNYYPQLPKSKVEEGEVK